MSDFHKIDPIIVAMVVNDIPHHVRYAGQEPREVCIAIEKDLRSKALNNISFVISARYPAHKENVTFYLADLLNEMNHDQQEGI